MDVCLANYGHCNYISPKHACIFYDEVGAMDAVLHIWKVRVGHIVYIYMTCYFILLC